VVKEREERMPNVKISKREICTIPKSMAIRFLNWAKWVEESFPDNHACIEMKNLLEKQCKDMKDVN
jgi:hypothetical protein